MRRHDSSGPLSWTLSWCWDSVTDSSVAVVIDGIAVGIQSVIVTRSNVGSSRVTDSRGDGVGGSERVRGMDVANEVR